MPTEESTTTTTDSGKNRLKFETGSVVCNDAVFVGDITFGAGTVVHPKAQILAEAGPIVFGENNLVEENAVIVNRHPSSAKDPFTLHIGNGNVFEIESRTEASAVGDNNVIELRAVVGPGVELSNGCVIGAACEVNIEKRLPDNTVFYGSESKQRISKDRPQTQQGQMDFLRKALPNYHYLASKK